MAAWIRCGTCKKVLAADAYDDGQATCRSCLTAPAPKPRTTRASAVTTVRSAVPLAERADRSPLLGVAGSGDLEVREKRARRAALEQLTELHSADFEQLLHAARQVEGLRT